MWMGQQNMDPFDIETRFSNEDGMSFLGSIFDSADEETLQIVDKVRNILSEIPSVEADFIDLYFFRRLRQVEIATIFGVSQPTVCYRLRRAAERIRFLVDMPNLDREKARRDLMSAIDNETDVDILISMLDTTCQSEVAKMRGVSQGYVRHRFVRSLKKLETSPGMDVYCRLFNIVSKNLNVLREVRRPDRVVCVLD